MPRNESKALRFILYSAENISAMLFGLLGAAMVARVFGPENLGRLSLVQATSSIFIFLATLGFDHFVIREFTKNRKDGELKGSILTIQTVGWVLYTLCLLMFFVYRDELASEVYLIASVAVSTYFLRVIFIKLYLQAINDAFGIALAAVVSRLVALIFLVAGTIYSFTYEVMIFFLPLQAVVQAGLMYFRYRDSELGSVPAHFSPTRVKNLLAEAFPVMVSSGLYFCYSQADILILSHFLNKHEVGVYSAAMRLVPQAAFLGHVSVMTFYGLLSDKYHNNTEDFKVFSVKIARLQFMLAFSLSLSFAILSPFVIWILYGEAYSESSNILAIGVWAWMFMLPACLFSRILVLAKLAKYELLKAVIVAPLSLGLNFVLIPVFGPIAAAVVSVLTYLIADLAVYSLFKETRFIFDIALEAMFSLVKHPVISLRESLGLFRKDRG